MNTSECYVPVLMVLSLTSSRVGGVSRQGDEEALPSHHSLVNFKHRGRRLMVLVAINIQDKHFSFDSCWVKKIHD